MANLKIRSRTLAALFVGHSAWSKLPGAGVFAVIFALLFAADECCACAAYNSSADLLPPSACLQLAQTAGAQDTQLLPSALNFTTNGAHVTRDFKRSRNTIVAFLPPSPGTGLRYLHKVSQDVLRVGVPTQALHFKSGNDGAKRQPNHRAPCTCEGNAHSTWQARQLQRTAPHQRATHRSTPHTRQPSSQTEVSEGIKQWPTTKSPNH